MIFLTFNYAISTGGFYKRYEQMINALIDQNEVHYISTSKLEPNDKLHQHIIEVNVKNKLFFWITFIIKLKKCINSIVEAEEIDKVILFGPSYGYLFNLFSKKKLRQLYLSDLIQLKGVLEIFPDYYIL